MFEKILTFLLPEVSFSRVSMPPLKETGDRVPSTDSSLNQSCNEDSSKILWEGRWYWIHMYMYMYILSG